MLSPSDLEARARLGDQTVATTPDDDQPGYSIGGQARFNGLGKPNVFDAVLVAQLAASGSAGDTQTVSLPYAPDWWHITVPSTANAVVEFSCSSSPSTPPDARIEAGGYCRIPGKGVYLSMRSTGSAAVTPTVLGASGPNAKDILIVPS